MAVKVSQQYYFTRSILKGLVDLLPRLNLHVGVSPPPRIVDIDYGKLMFLSSQAERGHIGAVLFAGPAGGIYLPTNHKADLCIRTGFIRQGVVSWAICISLSSPKEGLLHCDY